MSLSVLFDARLIVDKPTGIGQYITSLIPALLSADPDLTLHVILGPKQWEGYEIEDWSHPNLETYPSRIPPMAPRAKSALQFLAYQLHVDLIHYPHFNTPAIKRGKPVIATIHDLKYLAEPKLFTDWGFLRRSVMKRMFQRTLTLAKHIIADSQSTSDDIARLFPQSPVPRSVVHLAADPHFQPASEAEITRVRSAHGLTRPYVISVGERRPHKNHHTLIEAFAHSKANNTHDLVIVGQPHRKYRLDQETAERLSVSAQVHFLSNVDYDDLPALYSGATCFALASLYEGFGLPLLEAMACGCPVIGSSTTSTGEIIGDGGLTFDPTDVRAIATALSAVIHDEAKRTSLIDQGKKRAAQFTWERTAQQTLEVYRRVAAQSA